MKKILLFHPAEEKPFAEREFFQIRELPFNENEGVVEYGFQIDDGPILSDPYAREIATYPDSKIYRYRSVHRSPEPFDWGDDKSPRHKDEELVIYELNVRTFTASPTSATAEPGTFQALAQKIPYLKEIGVTAVELLPIFEFDSQHNTWGYNSINFFALKASYGTPLQFKQLVKELHKAGIEIILDVVYNHTPEYDETGETINYRGLDPKSYYILSEDGKYLNFSGCHNTFNCNSPISRELIMESLRYWVEEYHIDGYRFDLAPILERGTDGTPLGEEAPLVREMMSDPVLADIRLIAEPWDAEGLYRLGHFSSRGRWHEWNDKFRDSVRDFVKSDEAIIPQAIECIDGNPSIFPLDGPLPINFITAHDGFTLMDLVSYNFKHNEANGENGLDGNDANHSWNCGVEGPTTDEQINRLRINQIKNFITLLLLSRGIPMVTAGDEVGRTQWGNNNPYCIDDESVWFDWKCISDNSEILEHFKAMIRLRQMHPELISATARRTWSGEFRTRMLTVEENGRKVCILMNTHWESHDFDMPWSCEKKSVTVGPRSISVFAF